MTKTTASADTVLGPIRVAGRGGVVTDIRLPGVAGENDWQENADAFGWARQQLTQYAEGKRTTLDFDIAPEGTLFQQAVWQALRDIPFGETVSYADIAQAVGKPGGTQAVGQANGANPCPIIIPCHRVIAADGSLGGFSVGAAMKQRLLALEGIWEEQLPLF